MNKSITLTNKENGQVRQIHFDDEIETASVVESESGKETTLAEKIKTESIKASKSKK